MVEPHYNTRIGLLGEIDITWRRSGAGEWYVIL
jgi:hypothetical protein